MDDIFQYWRNFPGKDSGQRGCDRRPMEYDGYEYLKVSFPGIVVTTTFSTFWISAPERGRIPILPRDCN